MIPHIGTPENWPTYFGAALPIAAEICGKAFSVKLPGGDGSADVYKVAAEMADNMCRVEFERFSR